MPRMQISWNTANLGELVAVPSCEELIAEHASWLANTYNEPGNKRMLGNTCEATKDSVIEYYTEGLRDDAKMFLLFWNKTLIGDADFRNFKENCAEFAILIGDKKVQGKQFGTRFGIMLHHFAYNYLELQKVFATILPFNHPSLALFAKLGYKEDASSLSKSFAEDESDVCLSLSQKRFMELYGDFTKEIRVD